MGRKKLNRTPEELREQKRIRDQRYYKRHANKINALLFVSVAKNLELPNLLPNFHYKTKKTNNFNLYLTLKPKDKYSTSLVPAGLENPTLPENIVTSSPKYFPKDLFTYSHLSAMTAVLMPLKVSNELN